MHWTQFTELPNVPRRTIGVVSSNKELTGYNTESIFVGGP